MRSTFRVLFYTKNQAIKNGRVPVMGRITVNGTTASFSCKRDVPLALWDAKGNCAKGKSEEARRLNRELENIKAQIGKHYQYLSDHDFRETKTGHPHSHAGLHLRRIGHRAARSRTAETGKGAHGASLRGRQPLGYPAQAARSPERTGNKHLPDH